jgi:hypothetical protein
MEPTRLEELGWLHDSVVLNVIYDPTGADRLIKISVRCHDDCGYPPWDGKNLTLCLKNVATLKYIIHGLQTSPETIGSVHPGISSALQESTMRARRMGVRYPDLEFTISFHTGSSLEVICQELQVDIEKQNRNV